MRRRFPLEQVLIVVTVSIASNDKEKPHEKTDNNCIGFYRHDNRLHFLLAEGSLLKASNNQEEQNEMNHKRAKTKIRLPHGGFGACKILTAK